MLSHEETLKLIHLAQKGDKESAEIIYKENLPLIKSVIKRFRNSTLEFDDLMQLGSWGLYKAIMNFNPDYGVRFSTYAVPMISGEIKRHIRDDGPIKVSRHVKSQALEIQKFSNDFRHRNGREPTPLEIGENFGMSSYDVVFVLDSVRIPVSLYEQYDDDGGYLIDSIKTEDKTEDMIEKIMLRDIINSLDERDKKIILLRYYRDKTQTEVAEILGVSQVQVSRLENKILKEIKKKMQ